MMLQEIMKSALLQRNADGLVNFNMQCACLNDDLFPCGQPCPDCVAGRQRMITQEDRDNDVDGLLPEGEWVMLELPVPSVGKHPTPHALWFCMECRSTFLQGQQTQEMTEDGPVYRCPTCDAELAKDKILCYLPADEMAQENGEPIDPPVEPS